MTTTEQAIKVHDELSIEPAPVIPPDEIHPAPAESWAKGREFSVYRVPSQTLTAPHTVTYNEKLRVLYCDCIAAQFGHPCRHLKSVLWKRAFDAAFRAYHDLSLPELEDRQRDLEASQAPARTWRVIQHAIGEIVRQRTAEAA